MIESQEPNRRNVNCVRKRTKEIEKVTCCPSAAVLPFFCTLMPTINTYLCHKKRLRLFFPSITDSGRAAKDPPFCASSRTFKRRIFKNFNVG